MLLQEPDFFRTFAVSFRGPSDIFTERAEKTEDAEKEKPFVNLKHPHPAWCSSPYAGG